MSASCSFLRLLCIEASVFRLTWLKFRFGIEFEAFQVGIGNPGLLGCRGTYTSSAVFLTDRPTPASKGAAVTRVQQLLDPRLLLCNACHVRKPLGKARLMVAAETVLFDRYKVILLVRTQGATIPRFDYSLVVDY